MNPRAKASDWFHVFHHGSSSNTSKVSLASILLSASPTCHVLIGCRNGAELGFSLKAEVQCWQALPCSLSASNLHGKMNKSFLLPTLISFCPSQLSIQRGIQYQNQAEMLFSTSEYPCGTTSHSVLQLEMVVCSLSSSPAPTILQRSTPQHSSAHQIRGLGRDFGTKPGFGCH